MVKEGFLVPRHWLTSSGDFPCKPMIMVEYAAFKKTDHTVWSAITLGMKFHHAPSKSWVLHGTMIPCGGRVVCRQAR